MRPRAANPSGRRGCRPAGLIIAGAEGPRGHPEGHTMTTKQYLAALKELGLTPSGKGTAAALGLSLRQVQRIAAGQAAVPGPVAKLLDLYRKHGLSDA